MFSGHLDALLILNLDMDSWVELPSDLAAGVSQDLPADSSVEVAPSTSAQSLIERTLDCNL